MNAFVEHHKKSIQFGYRCFDRLLLNGLIQPFKQPERVLGFFNTYRQGRRVTRKTLTEIAAWADVFATGGRSKPPGEADRNRHPRPTEIATSGRSFRHPLPQTFGGSGT